MWIAGREKETFPGPGGRNVSVSISALDEARVNVHPSDEGFDNLLGL